MSCENKSVLTCKNCKHYEQCDKTITCIGQCNYCNDTNCENNKNYKEKNKMKTLQIPFYPDMEFKFHTDTYAQNGNTYIGLYCKEDGFVEPFCDLTVNLSVKLDATKAYIDINNCDMQLIRYLEENGFIEFAKDFRPSGYVTYPLYTLNLEKINEYTGDFN